MKLQFLQHTDLSNIIDTLISLSAAFILGALIGFERSIGNVQLVFEQMF